MLKYIFFRGLKFNPKIVTSFRSHGKWGDVIICLLPVSWCLNILSNSTTLLKIIEWQSEASILTIRIRGKQWYWVYKTDIKDISNLITSNLLDSKLNGGFISGYYNNADILLHRCNLFDSNLTGIKTYYLDNFDSYYDLSNLSLDESTLNILSLKKNRYVNFSISDLKFNSDSLLGNKINNINSSLINLFSNRSGVKKNFFRMDYKNFYNSYSLNFDFINYYRKFNMPKYSILTQKSIDNWVKENDVNYNNFFNYDVFYDYNSYNNFRLLRVNKAISMPADVFINVITNSFDVIHSWFIPGLGFKMDCVPGRSTHHSLYLDIPGIYYGQCAEICGRLHHHMPIKLCILFYDQFLSLYVFNNYTFNFLNNIKEGKRCL